MDKSGIVREESRLAIFIIKMNDSLSAQIDTVRAKYKRYFNQSSVLRTDQLINASF